MPHTPSHTARLAYDNYSTHRMLSVVRLRLQVVREDHFQKVVAGRPSNGSTVVIGPCEHV